MEELTKEQYAKIGKEAMLSRWPKMGEYHDPKDVYAAVGRAAYAASFPYAVAEALAEPSVYELLGPFSCNIGYPKEAVRSIFVSRLVRPTAKPDPTFVDLRSRYSQEEISDARLRDLIRLIREHEARKGAK